MACGAGPPNRGTLPDNPRWSGIAPDRQSDEGRNIRRPTCDVGSRQGAWGDEGKFSPRSGSWHLLPGPIAPEHEVQVPMCPGIRVDGGGIRLGEHFGTLKWEIRGPQLLSEDPFGGIGGGFELKQVGCGQNPPVPNRPQMRVLECSYLFPRSLRIRPAEKHLRRSIQGSKHDERREADAPFWNAPKTPSLDVPLRRAIAGEPGRRAVRRSWERAYGWAL